MTSDARFTILVTIILFLLSITGAGVVYLIKVTVRFTRVESALEALVEDVKILVTDKDRVHQAMYDTMRDDRSATDRRLRWLEEHLWKRNGGSGNTGR